MSHQILFFTEDC